MNKPVVLITGASTGIGYCTAELLSRQGWHVYGGARKQADRDRLNSLENVNALKLDVNDDSDIVRAIELISVEEGKLDGLVNNAGIVVTGPLMLLDEEDLQKQFNTNVLGLHKVTKAAFPLLLKAKGRIINISSVSGKFSYPFMGPYCMSKHALEAYSDSLRRELYPTGMKVVLIEPGNVKTPIWSKVERNDSRFKDSIFEGALNRLGDMVIKNVDRRSLEPVVIARLIRKGLIHKSPRDRYMKAENAMRIFLMRLLSARSLDKVINRVLS